MFQPLLALTLALAVVAPALGQSCDAVGLRIWRPDQQETRYAHGDVIRLEPGIEAHLYVHHASRSQYPYATSAKIGYPQDVGLRLSFDSRVLALRAQSDKDRKEGRLIFTTQAPGRTNLGYRITGVSQPGVFERLPARCRRGAVTIEVIDHGTGNGDQVSPATRQAARALAHELEKSLLPWRKAQVDDQELAWVLAHGRQGLVRMAATLLRSQAFREGSYYATIDADPRLHAEAEHRGDVEPSRVAEALLEGVYQTLYGELRPQRNLHLANRQALLACVSEEGKAREAACDQLAERLLASPAYTQRHRDALGKL